MLFEAVHEATSGDWDTAARLVRSTDEARSYYSPSDFLLYWCLMLECVQEDKSSAESESADGTCSSPTPDIRPLGPFEDRQQAIEFWRTADSSRRKDPDRNRWAHLRLALLYLGDGQRQLSQMHAAKAAGLAVPPDGKSLLSEVTKQLPDDTSTDPRPISDESPTTRESFLHLDTDQIGYISNTKLFLATSEDGFIQDTSTGSPLYSDVPEKIRGPGNRITTGTVLVQSTATVEEEPVTLESDLPFGRGVWVIIGAIIGWVFGPPIWAHVEAALGLKRSNGGGFLSGLIWAGVGVVALIGLVEWVFDPQEFRVYIDNATSADIEVTVDSLPPVDILSHTHRRISFKPGQKRFSVVRARDRTMVDSFVLTATETEGSYGGRYIYNVGAENRYSVKHVAYDPYR